ncbi:hypothetical protein [Mesorhizobium sp.]|uniref:hypothetical protein n=1 Tax=Mesorhizobium sp. TaxID=1871066 RepID=UPI002579E772|nr:hypothetical protein [Mesorhizobium sp.]
MTRAAAQSEIPPDIGGNAGLKACRIAGQQQALAGDEGEEPGRDAVIAQPLVLHRQQRGCHHECDAVDRPECFAKLGARHEGAGKAQGATDRQANCGDDIGEGRVGGTH